MQPATATVNYKPLKRNLGIYTKGIAGPTVVFVCGMHGNEPSSHIAFNRVLTKLNKANTLIKGKLVGILGNIPACEAGERFIDKDLNRLWTADNIMRIIQERDKRNYVEAIEQHHLYAAIKPYIEMPVNKHPVVFFDLHTTSSESKPYLLINDTLKNRSLAQKFPLPVVLGMEEHLKGTFLNYINDLGHISIGFEAGQHDANVSINNHEALIWQTLLHVGCLLQYDLPDPLKYHYILSKDIDNGKEIYEVRHRQHVVEQEGFEMKPGYINFQRVKKGEEVAKNNNGPIATTEKGNIFMPLYQKKGEDGFFVIRRVRWLWLQLSAFLRHTKIHSMLHYLPGVHQCHDMNETLVVNNRIAKYYVIEFFHLLGYRRKRKIGKYMLFTQRERLG